MMYLRLALTVSAPVFVFFGTFIEDGWSLMLAGIGIFLYDLAFSTTNIRGALLRGALLGIASGGAGVIWMWDMLPLPVPGGLSPATGFIVTLLVWGVTALLAGLTTSLMAGGLFLLRHNLFFAPLAGVFFIIEAVLRMWAYALYSYSPESLFGPHFSQTAFGYALADSGYLLHLAYPFGIFGLTFAVAVLGAACAFIVRARIVRALLPQAISASVFAVLLLVLPLVPAQESGEVPHLSIAAISLGGTDSDGAVAQKLLQEAAQLDVDVILLPEGSSLEKLFPNEESEAVLARLFAGREVLVLDSGYNETPDGTSYARIGFHSSTEGTIGGYRKLFLMPQAEYYPAIAEPLFALAGDPEMNKHLTGTGRRLVRGNALIPAEGAGVKVGALLCSEIMSPFLYRDLAGAGGVALLANLADPSWFHASHSLYTKTRQIARTHAVANRLPFALASTDAPALIVGPDGTILRESAWGEPAVLFAEFDSPSTQ